MDEIWDECRRLELEAENKTQLADRIMERWRLDGSMRFLVFAAVHKEWTHRLVSAIYEATETTA